MNGKFKDLVKRSISAFILAPIILLIILIGGHVFSALILLTAVLMAFEWNNITNNLKIKDNSLFWKVLGTLYIAIPMLFIMQFRNYYFGFELILWILFTVWATDIGGYIFGNLIGGPKIYPKISPKKTWAGAVGSILFAVLAGQLMANYFRSLPAVFYSMLISIFISIVAQFGDFLESAIKRKFDVKDSGNLIPGHGGILDRLDSIITSVIAVKLILILT
jgi:phosphatidate cytidylyltransferase